MKRLLQFLHGVAIEIAIVLSKDGTGIPVSINHKATLPHKIILNSIISFFACVVPSILLIALINSRRFN